MNHLTSYSKKLILQLKHQMHGIKGMCVFTPFLLASTACTDNQIAKKPNKETVAQQQQVVTLYTPSNAIEQGKLNALRNYISKQWRVTAINDRPIDYTLIVDLSKFNNNQGQAITDCGTIYFELDTSAVLSNNLSIKQINRTLKDCSNDVEDNVMRILSDLYSFDRQGDVLTLLSLKDKLVLTPIRH